MLLFGITSPQTNEKCYEMSPQFEPPPRDAKEVTLIPSVLWI